MNEEYEAGNSGGERRRRKRSGSVYLIIIILCVTVGICFFVYINKNTVYTSYRVIASREEPDSVMSEYLRYQNGYIRYTQDGAEAISDRGEAIWNISFNMKSPIAVSNGGYTAFAERGGRLLYVTDETGIPNTIDIAEEIMDVCIAKQGITAVWTSAGAEDHIYLYDITGTMLSDIETKVVKDGFPLAVSLSPDGRKLVTSYVRIGDEQETWVTFYNFGEVGQNYSDKVVGSYSFGTELIPVIRFIGDDYVSAFGENGFSVYKFREVPELIKAEKTQRKIVSMNNTDKYIGVITGTGEEAKTVILYDYAGKKITEFNTGIQYSEFYLSDSDIILHNKSEGMIYTTDGNEKFRASFDEDVKNIYPGGTDRKYMLIVDGRMDVIELVTAEEEAE